MKPTILYDKFGLREKRLKVFYCLFLLLLISSISFAQSSSESKLTRDSIRIEQIEAKNEPDKVLHAEPLYIDLIRDLGARKGEKEWNVGLGMTDNLDFDVYEMLVEYEFAPIDRLGLEIEFPFLFYAPQKGISKDSIPGSKMEALQLAGQWSFFVNQKIATSIALGYLHAFELSDFRSFGNPVIKGNVFNPFLVLAKRWGQNFHTLIYTGPVIDKFETLHTSFEVNTNVHYMIPGTNNFIGIEFNKSFEPGDFMMTIRPQMRIDLAEDLLIGIVAGIPVSRENERLSAFIRLIWEPGN